MRKSLFLTLLACLAAFNCMEALPKLSQEDINELNAALNHVAWYEGLRFDRIDSIRIRYQRSPDYKNRLHWIMRLGEEYSSFKADSAYRYYTAALQLANAEDDYDGQLRVRIARVKVLAVLGMYKEASDEIDLLQNENIPRNLRIELYDGARQLYYYLVSYVLSHDDFSKEYFNKNRYYRDLLLAELNHDNILYKIYYAEKLQDDGNINLSRDILLKLAENLRPESPEYARVMSHLALLAEDFGDKDEAAHYLARSAIADVRCAIKENVSLQNLAMYLYYKGDVNLAYKYLLASLHDANFCNSRLRNMQIAKDMPLINQAYRQQINAQTFKVRRLLIISVLLLAVILVIGVLLFRQYRKVRVVKNKLKSANSVKEEYIGHFLDLCSLYIDRLESFAKTVSRKVSTGQTEDLLKLAKSPKFMEEQNKLFYESFDTAFLHIYPTFVEEFNNLLKDDERIEVESPYTLTMELRIFAFYRLGIDDANKIASFLRYSVNTIYTYRNKVRSKAKNRETFDDDIMHIGDFSRV